MSRENPVAAGDADAQFAGQPVPAQDPRERKRPAQAGGPHQRVAPRDFYQLGQSLRRWMAPPTWPPRYDAVVKAKKAAKRYEVERDVGDTEPRPGLDEDDALVRWETEEAT